MLDIEVLTTVLEDLLSLPSKESPLTFSSHSRTVLFAVAPVHYPQTATDVIDQTDEKQRAKLSPERKVGFREAVKNLIDRTGEPVSFRNIAGKVKGVDIWDEQSPKTTTSQQRLSLKNRPVKAWCPGYSQDKQFAIVRLVVPWSIHHAEATYFLGWNQGKWVIHIRQFQYYP